MPHLQLGKSGDNLLEIGLKTLQRHFACFGSSGSGKTVAGKVMIEELARNGVPVIAFDPQGDIASLCLLEETDTIKDKGTDLSIRKSFNDNVEVVIWSPGSSKGLPICMNPLQFEGVSSLSAEDQTRTLSSVAKNIASLIGYDLDADDGKSAEAVMAVIFEYSVKKHVKLDNFNGLISILQDMPESVSEVVSAVASSGFIRGLIKKLSLLTLGSRKLIFQTGVPASIDVLLGLDEPNGKTRVSIIYLNTLSTAEEKEFFIAGITQMLYRWMLKNPPRAGFEGLQCALFIDEIAPYIPPVRKPACKESLELLFRQGRKYGVSCLIATQSPGDIDYKAIGQFSTFILGTLNTRQDIDKVKNRMESVAPKEIDYIVKKMPALKPGQFLVVSPDEFDSVQELQVRWLVTKHPLVISESQLSEYVPDDLRERYLPEPEPEQPDEQVETKPEKEPTESLTTEDQVLHVENKIFERDLEKKVKPHLEGGLFKSEKLDGTKFRYQPLVKVDLTFFQEKGFFKKKTVEIPENLYLDFKTNDLLHVKKEQFVFSPVLDMEPHEISDLDNHCKIETISKDEVDFDFRILGGKKLDKKAIKNMMERKYRVEVHKVEMVLVPTWECTLKQKKGKSTRTVTLDGIYGNEMKF